MLLFTVAPKPTSDVQSLTEEAPTTSQSLQESPNFDLLSNEALFDLGVTSSGAEPRRLDPEPLRDLAARVEATRMNLTWSASDGVFENFWVELSAQTPAAQPRIIILPGNVRSAEVEGLNPSTLYNFTLQGVVEGRPPLLLEGFATTGT